ncbi:uncharacterized protein BX664DRAFT_359744 [Halteromyces radiatus]|uniref:uncharacterized protein n=1 Tax=Halteromyces radiatus TaxID=101107 RepID=UPI00221E393E|nr:uncharacterized protein BX664DRAFT_359744 [Halteromyces radiatus]KAI8086196.1 hypothetical protein BX664DRAFT_359744 [Halteromyces radiatus]
MATESMQPFEQSFHLNVDPSSFHQASMAAAAGSAAAQAAAASSSTTTALSSVANHHQLHHPSLSHPSSMMSSNGYFSHPYYTQSPTSQEYHHLMDPYQGDFRPTFYNPFEIKHRRRTSRAQLKVLEKAFLENAKPNATVRRYLAQELDMTPRGVQIWFQNRRAKAKLQKRKSQQGSPITNNNNTNNTDNTNNNNSYLMTPTSSSPSSCLLSSTPSSSSCGSNSSLFYSMDDIRSVATQAAAQSMLMLDHNSWLTMPAHLSQHQENDLQRRQSCPLLSQSNPLWDTAMLQQQNRRASENNHSSPVNTTMMGWMDPTDANSCCSSNSPISNTITSTSNNNNSSSSSSSGSSSCGTPGWTLDTTSPLSDHTILDMYQQQQSGIKLSFPPTTPTLDFYHSSSSPSVTTSSSQSPTCSMDQGSVPLLTHPLMSSSYI